MTDKYFEFYKNMALFEIATIQWVLVDPSIEDDKKRKICKVNSEGFINGVLYGQAYEKKLNAVSKFECVDWDKDPFSRFKIIKASPPKKLKLIDRSVQFESVSSLKVENSWEEFFISFHQVRHNLVHGAKLMKGLKNLEDRDLDLIDACLAFIKFMQDERIVDELY